MKIIYVQKYYYFEKSVYSLNFSKTILEILPFRIPLNSNFITPLFKTSGKVTQFEIYFVGFYFYKYLLKDVFESEDKSIISSS
jgi:hypothetical protein